MLMTTLAVCPTNEKSRGMVSLQPFLYIGGEVVGVCGCMKPFGGHFAEFLKLLYHRGNDEIDYSGNN